MLQLRFRSAVLLSSAFWIISLSSAGAQQPANAQPNTFSTVAGGYSGTYTAGGVCGGASSGSKYTSVDTFGNGCPLTQAVLGPSLSGLGVDGLAMSSLRTTQTGKSAGWTPRAALSPK